MSSEHQPRLPESKGLEIALVLLGMIVAWPAFLVGVVARFFIKQRTSDPFPYWIAAGLALREHGYSSPIPTGTHGCWPSCVTSSRLSYSGT